MINVIYIVNWFSSEPYENCSGPHKAFYTEEAAKKYVEDYKEKNGPGPYDDEEGYGWYLATYVEKVEIVNE